MVKQVRKRDGQIQEFNKVKIADAIYRNLVKECFSEKQKLLGEYYGKQNQYVYG